ncbi:MAG: helix-turn-helix domain-containing protein [Thermoguttaceae bacterium]|jgi:transposase
MPQSLLPMIPEGASRISDLISVVRENGVWTYFCGVHPVFCHPEEDRRSFRMFTAQLVCQGSCREVDILRVFGVSKNSVKRSVKKYREEGIEGFYGARKRRGATVLTAEVTAAAQGLLSSGRSRREVAEELGLKYDTLRKAIQQGRLQELPGPAQSAVASDKSQRSSEDVVAEMGTACTRPVERVLAALGMLEGTPTRFEPCRDVSYGGVLCARQINSSDPFLPPFYPLGLALARARRRLA